MSDKFLQQDAAEDLKVTLGLIHKYDTDYEFREQFVYEAIVDAKRAGFACGFRIDPTEPEWPVAYIELPTGQVSWHMPQHPEPYDGHSTEEKYQRIAEWVSKKTPPEVYRG